MVWLIGTLFLVGGLTVWGFFYGADDGEED